MTKTFKSLVLHGQTLFLCRGVTAFSTSVPCKKVWDNSLSLLFLRPTDIVGH